MAPTGDDGLVLLLRAIDIAAKAHRKQRRKDDKETPYINHPIEVARILADEGGVDDPEIITAALLHDTVEDTATSLDEIRGAFGDRVARIVGEVTDDKSLPKVERKRLQIIHASEISRGARLVKLADKISNLRGLRSSVPKGWDAARVRG
ncbi:MAG TPA: HD domain-containing protein, partial [Planctomycetota bacterium]|nr:HD domain-containing protein [Planctomycetota bacterium]